MGLDTENRQMELSFDGTSITITKKLSFSEFLEANRQTGHVICKEAQTPASLSPAGAILLPYKCTIPQRHILRNKPQDLPMQIEPFPQLHDFLHHGRVMMCVNGLLAFPAVDEKDPP